MRPGGTFVAVDDLAVLLYPRVHGSIGWWLHAHHQVTPRYAVTSTAAHTTAHQPAKRREVI